MRPGKFLKALVAGTVLGAFGASDVTFWATMGALTLDEMDKQTRALYEEQAAIQVREEALEVWIESQAFYDEQEALRARKEALNNSQTFVDDEQAIQAREKALNDWIESRNVEPSIKKNTYVRGERAAIKAAQVVLKAKKKGERTVIKSAQARFEVKNTYVRNELAAIKAARADFERRAHKAGWIRS